MTTPAQWLEGARPRTLPAAVAPVLVGTGAAAQADGSSLVRAALALVVALALQVGVNYANDYSDGVRGTDDHRVGPLRLVGSGAAPPAAVRGAALACFGLAAAVGFVLSAMASWWLLVVGAAAIAAAWAYTGTTRPYGYRGLGEVSVFVFFGLVAVLGTTYVQAERLTWPSLAGAVGCGALACAILVTNNLRDIPTDEDVGKRTLAVVLGDRRTRTLYPALVGSAFAAAVVVAPAAPGALLALLAAPLAAGPVAAVRSGLTGRGLVPVLAGTGRLQMAYGVLLALGLAVSG
ncbi:MAG: 1,4-dihydroxy-2-naphthoate polyprenyltransferase [uncultured Frankineae bacterium]|uniref:1,4-dihydroxy-2-naphthoate octaprenyltransferase n=1 Tax=uncultured Frankineae bacterium TaxID=437475 RepID=A0A6J4MHX1_9ACTN|nr:MAG: 1,4-dihydroxy-2-naphthoate polyprenyltransferase [uncultured Frankineae bacterium]